MKQRQLGITSVISLVICLTILSWPRFVSRKRAWISPYRSCTLRSIQSSGLNMSASDRSSMISRHFLKFGPISSLNPNKLKLSSVVNDMSVSIETTRPRKKDNERGKPIGTSKIKWEIIYSVVIAQVSPSFIPNSWRVQWILTYIATINFTKELVAVLSDKPFNPGFCARRVFATWWRKHCELNTQTTSDRYSSLLRTVFDQFRLNRNHTGTCSLLSRIKEQVSK